MAKSVPVMSFVTGGKACTGGSHLEEVDDGEKAKE